MPLLSLPLSCITERLLLRTVRDSSILVRGPTLVKKSVRLGMTCGRVYGRRYGPIEPKSHLEDQCIALLISIRAGPGSADL